MAQVIYLHRAVPCAMAQALTTMELVPVPLVPTCDKKCVYKAVEYFWQTKVCQVRVTVDLPTFCLVTIFSVESKELELELEQPKKNRHPKKMINLKELGKCKQEKFDKYVKIEN